MPSQHSHRRSRSRSRSHSGRHHSRSNSVDRSFRSLHYERRYKRQENRNVKDEFGREVYDLLAQRDLFCREPDDRSNRRRNHSFEREEKTFEREKSQHERDSSYCDRDRNEVIHEADNYEIEEGEDTMANMESLMGFGSFSTTKNKHVVDNDSKVNMGTARVVKQHKAMRILNRRAKIITE